VAGGTTLKAGFSSALAGQLTVELQVGDLTTGRHDERQAASLVGQCGGATEREFEIIAHHHNQRLGDAQVGIGGVGHVHVDQIGGRCKSVPRRPRKELRWSD
jgi:hypothetical protein